MMKFWHASPLFELTIDPAVRIDWLILVIPVPNISVESYFATVNITFILKNMLQRLAGH
jgi:hypothetical protein